MYEWIKGKKLLVIGASDREIDLIRRAQSFGVYVIACDYYPIQKAPAKAVADEAWDMSWLDLEKLAEKCKESHIDGVIAGYSEERIQQLIKLCDMLALPCYSNMDQLKTTWNKDIFKETCRKYGVSVINEYNDIKDVKKFPVIVKPVDRGGSIGISVANSVDELKKAYDYAMEKSFSKRVIIEDYITDCLKVDYTYTISDGKIDLAANCNTIASHLPGDFKIVQNAWIYPQANEEIAVKKADPALRTMIEGMGIKHGIIFFSGFVDKKGNTSFFECGFRLSGSNKFEYVYRKGGCNYLDIFILHALTGSNNGIHRNEHSMPNLKCLTVNYYASNGRLSKFSGFAEISSLPDCLLADKFLSIGDVCKDDIARLSRICRFSFCNTDAEKLIADAEVANNLLVAENESGQSMIYDKVSIETLRKFWHINT